MARPSIVEKLRSELHRPVKTEMQVVYILVEVRKLIEHDKQQDVYPVLNFYGNWVVHTKLSASAVADRIVRLADEIMYRRANGTVDTTLEDEAVDFTEERLLRDQLRTFLESSDLPTEICTDPARWEAFRKRLVGVIEDVPLELRRSERSATPATKESKPTHFVESVIVKNKSTDDALNVEWKMVMHSQPVIRVKDGKMKLIEKHAVKG
ncbi:MAG TPA: hypothetical protein VGG97_08520 [Bryobacteraceae bacterium]